MPHHLPPHHFQTEARRRSETIITNNLWRVSSSRQPKPHPLPPHGFGDLDGRGWGGVGWGPLCEWLTYAWCNKLCPLQARQPEVHNHGSGQIRSWAMSQTSRFPTIVDKFAGHWAFYFHLRQIKMPHLGYQMHLSLRPRRELLHISVCLMIIYISFIQWKFN